MESMPMTPLDANRVGLWDRLKACAQTRDGRVGLAGASACLAVLAWIFADTLRHFVYTWSTDGNYSHGFLVPLLTVYFANEAARQGTFKVRSGVALGAILIALAMIGRLMVAAVPIGIVGDLSFLLGLCGICSLFAGAANLRRFGFALGFLVFMVPLPIALYSRVAAPLQLIVSQISAGFLSAINIPVLREGNVMTLPGGLRMFVAEACSGMRQMTGFFALTTAVAYLSARPAWYRALVIAASFPIALVANVVRVVLTGVIMYHFDSKYASGTFHTLEGLLMMGFGLGLLALFRVVLDQFAGARPSPLAAAASSKVSEPIEPESAQTQPRPTLVNA
jgi:exosortase